MADGAVRPPNNGQITVQSRAEHGRFAPGNRHGRGRPRGSKNRFSDAVLNDLLDDWQIHGPEVIDRVRREAPVAYLKIVAHLVRIADDAARDRAVEQLTDAELDAAVEYLLAKIQPVDVMPDHVEHRPHD